MWLLIINDIHLCDDTDDVNARGRTTWPYGRPTTRGHHVGKVRKGGTLWQWHIGEKY